MCKITEKEPKVARERGREGSAGLLHRVVKPIGVHGFPPVVVERYVVGHAAPHKVATDAFEGTHGLGVGQPVEEFTVEKMRTARFFTSRRIVRQRDRSCPNTDKSLNSPLSATSPACRYVQREQPGLRK